MTAWKKTFISAFTAQLISMIGFTLALPFIPFFIAELGVDDKGEQAFWAGIALAAAALPLALFAPLWGILADRYGRKLMVCRAMLGGTVVLFLMSLVRTMGQLLVCRLMQGAFTGTIAASVALVASVVPQRRTGMALGMMQTAVLTGTIIGPFFGGILADAFGYRAAFRAGALLCLLGGILIYFGTDEKMEPAPKENVNDNNGFVNMLFLKGFFIAVIVMFGVQFSNSIINPSFPLIVEEMVPDSPNINSITGMLFAAAALAGACSAALLGHVGDSLGHKRILIGCCIGACIASAGHFAARDLNELLIARVLFGLAIAGMMPAANSMIHKIIGTASLGKAYGLATSLSMLGMAIGPYLGGYLARHAGLRLPFLVSAAAHLVLIFIVAISARLRRTGGTISETVFREAGRAPPRA